MKRARLRITLCGGGQTGRETILRLDDIKTVLRCRDLRASRRFYTEILRLDVVDEWKSADGNGVIVVPRGRDGAIELSETPRDHPSYAREFAEPLQSDKVELQFRCSWLDDWVKHLKGRWDFEGPALRPWGRRYIWLRDPDNVRISIFEVVE